ncbi:MAG: hypothetical protein J5I81_06300 [Nitrococcus mobilis]|nr:hypothetical protein [Nitrococcus mobilis]
MAAPVGSLVVRIGANTAGLERGARRATSSLKRIGARAAATASRLAALGAAAAAAGAAIGAHLVKSQLDAIQAINRLNKVTGIQIRTIQAATVEARRFGISSERAADALTDFSERVGEARTGTGEAVDGFKLLEKASGRQIDLTQNVNKVWVQFLDAMSRVEDESTKAAAAAMIGGDALRDMIPALSGGAEGFRKAADQAEQFGFAMSKVDTQQAVRAQRALASAGNALEGVVQRVAVQVAPVVEALANKFTEAARETGGFRDKLAQIGSVILKLEDMIFGSFQVAFTGAKLAAQGFASAFWFILSDLTRGVARFLDFVSSGTNAVISGLNAIPGIDIELITSFQGSELQQRLDSITEGATDAVRKTRAELVELTGRGLPTIGLEQWVREVQEKAQQAAAEVVKVRNAPAHVDLTAGGDTQQQEEDWQRRLETIRNRFVTEQELQREHLQVMADIKRGFKEGEIETEAEFRELQQQAEAAHMQKLVDLRRRGMSAMERFTAMSFAEQSKTVAGELQSMTDTVATQNKVLFRINQAAAIANAIINTKQGITKTLATYAWPLAGIMAAAHAAAGFAQVNAIRAQSFGGGGGAAPSLAGSTPATPVTPVGGDAGQSSPQPVTNISLRGDSFDRKSVRNLLESINDNMADGGRIVVTSG